LWYEERASPDEALTKPLEIVNAHSTLPTCLYLCILWEAELWPRGTKKAESFNVIICVKVIFSEDGEMNKILKDQWKEASGFGLNDIFRLRPWFLIVTFLIFSAGCSNATGEQATTERMTVVAAGQISTTTRQAELDSATGEDMEAVVSTADAATAGAGEEMAAQAMAETEATEEAAVVATAVAEALATAEAQVTAGALAPPMPRQRPK
jgi:hypothetical protein